MEKDYEQDDNDIHYFSPELVASLILVLELHVLNVVQLALGEAAEEDMEQLPHTIVNDASMFNYSRFFGFLD